MLLHEFIAKLSTQLSPPTARGHENEIAARELAAVLGDDEFVVDCMARQFAFMRIPLRVRRENSIWYARCAHFNVHLIFWPAGYSVTPHEHSRWTVSGVLHNRIEGVIYPSVDDLVPLRKFEGAEGDVGTLEPPCVHQITNPTDRTAVTIHLFGLDPAPGGAETRNNRSGGDPTQTPKRSGPANDRYRDGLRERMECSMIELLAKRPSAQSLELLDEIRNKGSSEAQILAEEVITNAQAS